MNIKRFIPTIVTITVIIVLWEVGLRFSNLPAYIFPAPSDIFKAAFSRPIKWHEHIWATLSETILGFFFGAIVVPCNPLFIAVLFTKTVSTSALNFIENIVVFMFFGIGIAFPLLLFSLVSAALSHAVIGYLVRYKRIINLLSGIVMLIISIYYLVFVFRVFG